MDFARGRTYDKMVSDYKCNDNRGCANIEYRHYPEQKNMTGYPHVSSRLLYVGAWVVKWHNKLIELKNRAATKNINNVAQMMMKETDSLTPN